MLTVKEGVGRLIDNLIICRLSTGRDMRCAIEPNDQRCTASWCYKTAYEGERTDREGEALVMRSAAHTLGYSVFRELNLWRNFKTY